MYSLIETNTNIKNKIVSHGRFREDGFIIFNGSLEEATRFFEIGNQVHPLLKFTYEISESSMVFLDTVIYKGIRFTESGVLDTKSYIKPTNSFQFLHRTSAHHKSVFKGFIKGECIRHARNTSSRDILIKELSDFKIQLLKRGYSENETNAIISEICAADRNKFTNKKRKNKNKQIPNVLITKYDPRINGIKKKLMKYWSTVMNDEQCKKIFTAEPMVAFSKYKNIGDLVTHSLLFKVDS